MKYAKICSVVMVCILFFSGCSKGDPVENLSAPPNMVVDENSEGGLPENTATDDDKNRRHLSYEITDNIRIDADVSGYRKDAQIYEAVKKEFSSDILTKYFFSDLTKIKQNDNPNGTDLTAEDGSSLFVGKGCFDYSAGNNIEDIKYLIQGAYFSELSYQNKNPETMQKLCEDQVVKDALEKIEQLYCPEDNERIELLNGVKIESKKLLDRQALEIEKFGLQNLIDMGKANKVDKTMIPKDCFYLILGVSRNEIPVIGIQEPYVSTADEDAIYENTSIEVLAGPMGIKSIRVAGAYTCTESETADVLPLEEICNTIKKKYDMQILSSEHLITKVWLEYVFIPDFTAKDLLEEGKLQPYWCFEIMDQEDPEESNAERINAVSGGDLTYGE